MSYTPDSTINYIIYGDDNKSTTKRNTYNRDPYTGEYIFESINQNTTIQDSGSNSTFEIKIIPNENVKIINIKHNIQFVDTNKNNIIFYSNSQGDYFAKVKTNKVINKNDIIFTVVYNEMIETILFNNNYLLSEENIQQFKEEDMTERSPFIISMLNIPFKIDTKENTIETAFVQFGKIPSDILNPLQFTSEYLNINLGVITLPALNNSIEIETNSYTLYLPYMDKIKLDAALYNGSDIKIEWILDLYTGEVTTNIYKNDEIDPKESHKNKLGREIPLISALKVEGSLSTMNGSENNIDNCYIAKLTDTLGGDTYNNLITVEGIIDNYKGFCIVDDIHLQGNVTQQEQEQIKILLQQGVYIN